MESQDKLISQNVYYDGKFCLVNSETEGSSIYTLRDLRTSELYFDIDRKKFLTINQLKERLK